MSEPAPVDSDEELGVCEFEGPQPERLFGSPATVGLQPVVHASRSCAEYLPHIDHEDDGEPAAPPAKRHLQAVPTEAA
jgi:hypothetical protein